MGLSPLYDAGGNPLKDAGGNQLYVEMPTPDPRRIAKVPKEVRIVKIGKD